MKKIVLWLMSTLTALVLLFGYHTSTSSTSAAGGNRSAATPYTGSTSGSGAASTPTTGGSGTGSTSGSGSGGAAAPGNSGTSRTVTGNVADTRWGPVQVQLTVAGGAITDVAVVQYPDGNGTDQAINAQALPILIQETLNAQSADIDMVSGATYTSDGYVTSLQSALDQAGL